jgi:hypothetical protein
MPKFDICTTDGQTTVVDRPEPTPIELLNAARTLRVIEGIEVWRDGGRPEKRNPVAIAFDAIVLIRPSRS